MVRAFPALIGDGALLLSIHAGPPQLPVAPDAEHPIALSDQHRCTCRVGERDREEWMEGRKRREGRKEREGGRE